MDLTEAVYKRAIDSIRRCCGPWGIEASGRTVGHHQVWARDSMIASLGARLVDDVRIQTALRASVSLLKDHQAPTGAIPNNVDCATLRPNFRAYADGGLWWIVGSALVEPDARAVRAILRWCECQDVDRSGCSACRKPRIGRICYALAGRGYTSTACMCWRCAPPGSCSKRLTARKANAAGYRRRKRRTRSTPGSGIREMATCCRTFPIASARQARVNSIHWGANGGFPQSGI